MSSRPVVGVVAAAAQTDANLVWDALGRGPATFSIALSADASEPATHYAFHDGSATDTDAAAWQGMVDGVLPDGPDWGVGGVIGEVAALAACAPASMVITSRAGDMDAASHFYGVLAGMGLQIVVGEL